MTISLIQEPEINIDIIGAPVAAQNTEQRVLFVGQMKTGSATGGTLVENIGISGEEDALFGANSHLAGMIRAARQINKVNRFDALPLADNGAGTAASGTIAFADTASAAGELIVTVGSSVNHQYIIPVANGATATAVGAALAAAINADPDAMFSAINTTGSVAITCEHKGTIGNFITLKVDGTVAGLGVTVTAFASGATDPSLTSVFDPIGDMRYQTIVWPGAYSKSTLTSFLDARFNSANQILDGVGITTNTDTYANILTALGSLNSKSLIYVANKKVNDTYFKGSSLTELNDHISAQFSAIRALRFTEGQDISRFVVASDGSLDAFGGIHLASKPYANTPLDNLPIIPTGKGFSLAEISAIYSAGGAVFGNNTSANKIICGRLMTTYKTDGGGNPDPSFSFLNYVDTSSAAREFFSVNLRANYSQSRLTTGDVIPNIPMANASSIGAFLDGLYVQLSEKGLVQAGEAAIKFFKLNRSISIDMSVGKVTVTMLVPIVTQLRTIIATMQISFQQFGQ